MNLADKSSETAKKRRGIGRPFPKGVSPNPGGRPKGLGEIIEQARTHGGAALETLAAIMTDKDARHADRIAAATALLDRGFGKPIQQQVNVQLSPIERLPAESRRVLMDILKMELARRSADQATLIEVPSPTRFKDFWRN